MRVNRKEINYKFDMSPRRMPDWWLLMSVWEACRSYGAPRWAAWEAAVDYAARLCTLTGRWYD